MHESPGTAFSRGTMKSRRAWNSAQRVRTMSIGPLSAATPAAWLTDDGLSELWPCMRAMARISSTGPPA